MGTNLKDLIVAKEVGFAELKGKKVAVDSFNILYQFLSTIRQRDGSLLKDSQGRVTSHLAGLFSRTTRLMQYEIQPCFVFDGKAPSLKTRERERRIGLKQEAQKLYEKAKEEENLEEMKKYASRTSSLNKEMIDESKALLDALGLPVVQAASEGEAQMAHIVNSGEAYAGVSEDYDSLLYGITNLLKNLTISGKKKKGATYISVKPKIINFSENINLLGIDKDKLIMLAMLVGTDYNPGGVKGIGPKTALKLVKEHGNNPEKLFNEIEWDKHVNVSWNEIYELFKNMPVNRDYILKWKPINHEKVKEILVEEHEFSMERIDSTLQSMEKQKADTSQKGLGQWFK